MQEYEIVKWKEWCPSCKRHHIVSLQPCPDCGIYDVPQPHSEKVQEKCRRIVRCEGCEAYQDHLK